MSKDIFSQALTTGTDGMVGSYIDFGIRTNKHSLDVADLEEVLRVCRKYKPKVILHLAAETDVKRCERDPQYAYFVNTIGTYNMAVAAKEVGAKFIYISTSAIFSGLKEKPYEETDEPDPQSYYGRSKFLGEVIVRGILKDYIIGRICWVFGGGPNKDQKFVAKIIRQLGEEKIQVVTDKIGSPTFGKDLVSGIKTLLRENKRGIFHLANKGCASRYDVALEIMKILHSKVKVVPVDSSYFSKDTERLSNESMASKVNIMRPWQEALKEYLESEWAEYQIKK